MAAERYHGSARRAAVHDFFQDIGDRLKALTRWSRGKPAANDGPPPEIATLLDRVERLSQQHDWPAALASAGEAADIAERKGYPTRHIGAELVRLGDCRRGITLMAPTLDLSGFAGKLWEGEDLEGRTLVVMQRTGADMGAPIRLGRFVACAEAKGAHSIIAVEPRLVPLFHRTFPRAAVRASDGQHLPTAPPGALATSFEGLTTAFVTDWASIAAMPFVPLRPDPKMVAELRAKYRRDSGPVIGITWGSKNTRKDAPSLADWGRLVQAVPGTFVSLQYGPIAPALRTLGGNNPDKLIADASVDQMVDMDRFAAQVASLDGVIAVSNTAAHLAGALGVPMVLVMGDNFKGQFPYGTASGWYPRAIQVRKNRRSWNEVMREARERLSGMLAETRSGTA